jgi:hypothetical protein
MNLSLYINFALLAGPTRGDPPKGWRMFSLN